MKQHWSDEHNGIEIDELTKQDIEVIDNAEVGDSIVNEEECQEMSNNELWEREERGCDLPLYMQ